MHIAPYKAALCNAHDFVRLPGRCPCREHVLEGTERAASVTWDMLCRVGSLHILPLLSCLSSILPAACQQRITPSLTPPPRPRPTSSPPSPPPGVPRPAGTCPPPHGTGGGLRRQQTGRRATSRGSADGGRKEGGGEGERGGIGMR